LPERWGTTYQAASFYLFDGWDHAVKEVLVLKGALGVKNSYWGQGAWKVRARESRGSGGGRKPGKGIVAVRAQKNVCIKIDSQQGAKVWSRQHEGAFCQNCLRKAMGTRGGKVKKTAGNRIESELRPLLGEVERKI